MKYTSTRGRCEAESAAAIARGIAADGGLYVPEEFPRLGAADLDRLAELDYRGRAKEILSRYLTDFTPEEIARCVDAAYTGTFDGDTPAPLVEVAPGMHLLELWHGPTCAFKDLALQLLPHLLTVSARKAAPDKTLVILVATSGDTGKAALAGFAGVEGTRIIVFYPRDGVSEMQKLQMTTQRGNNVAVCAVDGNFDDAQSGVKAIFADGTMRAELDAKNLAFSSANSINFGRLVPQIVYYVSAWCDLRKAGKCAADGAVNVAVPTGNFGNILAAYYAKRMGVPIRRFICASNRNSILTDFIRSGVYDRNREFYTTSSPSMDILISSNLERLLWHLSGNDCRSVAAWMESLRSTGRYEVPAELGKRLRDEFHGDWCGEEGTRATIGRLFRENGYLCDTHTAVAVDVCTRYRAESGDDTPCIVASTASPFKFAPAVLSAISPEEKLSADGFALLERLSRVSGAAVPKALAELRSLPVLHRSSVPRTGMEGFIREFLG